MGKLLVVVDMQNDFIDGALGTSEAVKILPRVVEKIKEYQALGDQIIFTKDTHLDNYAKTQEGKNLPVPHCIKSSHGWEICRDIQAIMGNTPYKIYEKETFGSSKYAADLMNGVYDDITAVELVGLCTDICVISNALITKAMLPEIPVLVDRNCCAGVTPQSHENALEAMKMCQIQCS